MGPLDALWHLLNLVAPAVGTGVVASLIAKLLWRRELKGASWLRLSLWASGASTLALLAGLLVFGRDGKMASYGAMLLACALSLWAFAFGLRR